jgi:hypothetical protein
MWSSAFQDYRAVSGIAMMAGRIKKKEGKRAHSDDVEVVLALSLNKPRASLHAQLVLRAKASLLLNPFDYFISLCFWERL